ncbi:MAG: hypothetical protein WA797_11735 [Acidimicrobiales bacterium]
MFRRRRPNTPEVSDTRHRGSAQVPSASAPDALASAQPTPAPDVDPAGYTAEAERFATAVSGRSPGLHLDFTPESVARLDTFMAGPGAMSGDGYVLGLGCYVGEVIRRNVGGAWVAEGTLVEVGSVAETFPLLKARAHCAPSSSHEAPEPLRSYLEAVLMASSGN